MWQPPGGRVARLWVAGWDCGGGCHMAAFGVPLRLEGVGGLSEDRHLAGRLRHGFKDS